MRYACCHGYQRSKGESACSKVTMKSLEETVKEQGGEEFLAMVKEVKEKMKANCQSPLWIELVLLGRPSCL